MKLELTIEEVQLLIRALASRSALAAQDLFDPAQRDERKAADDLATKIRGQAIRRKRCWNTSMKLELTIEEVQLLLKALATAASETPSRSLEAKADALAAKIRGQMIK